MASVIQLTAISRARAVRVSLQVCSKVQRDLNCKGSKKYMDRAYLDTGDEL